MRKHCIKSNLAAVSVLLFLQDVFNRLLNLENHFLNDLDKWWEMAADSTSLSEMPAESEKKERPICGRCRIIRRPTFDAEEASRKIIACSTFNWGVFAQSHKISAFEAANRPDFEGEPKNRRISARNALALH